MTQKTKGFSFRSSLEEHMNKYFISPPRTTTVTEILLITAIYYFRAYFAISMLLLAIPNYAPCLIIKAI